MVVIGMEELQLSFTKIMVRHGTFGISRDWHHMMMGKPYSFQIPRCIFKLLLPYGTNGEKNDPGQLFFTTAFYIILSMSKVLLSNLMF